MKYLKTTSLLAASLALALAAFAESPEKTLSLDKIPAPASQALQKASGGARIEKLSEEKDEGRTVYEAKFTKAGHVQEVSVDAEGKIVSVEKVIALSDVPEAVRKTIEANSAGGKVEKVEHIDEGGKVTYEALVTKDGKREEIVISPDGKVTEREDKSHDKEKD